MVLAQHAPGHITSIDLFPTLIDLFNLNAQKLNLQDRVNGVVGSMDNLPFQDEELDLTFLCSIGRCTGKILEEICRE